MGLKNNKEAIKAIYIGLLCTLSYLGCYFARNILGVVTPQMLEENILSIESIGGMSTGFMILYATGQLVNGRVGDIIKTKYMVSIGIILAGICNAVLIFAKHPSLSIVVYSLSGFFLSMIYAPIMKVVSENTLPVYATRCSLGFVIASFLGTPLASVFAIFFRWKTVFIICAVSLIVMGIMAFCVFSWFEKIGFIGSNIVKQDKKDRFDLKLLVKRSIIRFSVIAILTGIIRTSVVFWIPTYLTEYLLITPESAAAIFTVITLLKSASPYFNSLVMYERVFKRNINITIFFMFLASAVSFLCMFLIHNTMINIIFLTLALITSGGAATMVFSVYCPSLCDTGMVSTATGFLDCMSYIGAAVANLLFSNAISTIGWGNLILVWTLLMTVGVFAGTGKKSTENT
ncbi:MAG: MFS transporter [Ruminococcaceae bacterium]|nr:MFS transporter [Oscillospiraceae bacterium]